MNAVGSAPSHRHEADPAHRREWSVVISSVLSGAWRRAAAKARSR